MLQELIDVFEEVKKYVYIIDRGDNEPIIIKFKNEHFYHLIGLHKLNIEMFFPKNMHSKDKRYKHIKKNVEKYENIIKNQIKEKDSLELRMETFHYITSLLSGENERFLYNLKGKVPGSMYNGDYGLLIVLENLFCLLGIKKDESSSDMSYVPQSWMASNRINKLVFGKPPIYYKKIIAVPCNMYSDTIRVASLI